MDGAHATVCDEWLVARAVADNARFNQDLFEAALVDDDPVTRAMREEAELWHQRYTRARRARNLLAYRAIEAGARRAAVVQWELLCADAMECALDAVNDIDHDCSALADGYPSAAAAQAFIRRLVAIAEEDERARRAADEVEDA